MSAAGLWEEREAGSAGLRLGVLVLGVLGGLVLVLVLGVAAAAADRAGEEDRTHDQHRDELLHEEPPFRKSTMTEGDSGWEDVSHSNASGEDDGQQNREPGAV